MALLLLNWLAKELTTQRTGYLAKINSNSAIDSFVWKWSGSRPLLEAIRQLKPIKKENKGISI